MVGAAWGSAIPIFLVRPSERTFNIPAQAKLPMVTASEESPIYPHGWTLVLGRKGRMEIGLPLNPVASEVELL